jgi:hypothetical protein
LENETSHIQGNSLKVYNFEHADQQQICEHNEKPVCKLYLSRKQNKGSDNMRKGNSCYATPAIECLANGAVQTFGGRLYEG